MPDRRTACAVAGTLLLIALALAGGCSASGGGDAVPGDARAPVEVPAPPDLAEPAAAVRSYTEWISYAYVEMRSEVAAHAMSAYEEVRVDAYIQRNILEQRRGIHQSLVESAYRVASQEESSAVVVGTEDWVYRYFDIRSRDYTSPVYEASYDVTYTVIVEQPKGWVVDRVEATPRGEVK